MTGCSAIFNHGIEIRQNPKKSIKRDEETPPLWLPPRQLRRPIPSLTASRVRWRLLGPHVNGSLKRTCADLEAKTSRSSIGWAKCAKRSARVGRYLVMPVCGVALASGCVLRACCHRTAAAQPSKVAIKIRPAEMCRLSRSGRAPLLIRLTVPEGERKTADAVSRAAWIWSAWIGLALMATCKRLVRLGNLAGGRLR